MSTPNRSASYTLFSRRKKLIYSGSAGQEKPKQNGKDPRGVRDRLIDHYYERGDHRTVPGKDKLTKEAAYFDVKFGNVYDNRQRERNLKREAKPKFNVR